MPTFIKIKGYRIFFWSNENHEPIHFHVCQGNPSENSTKIWLLSNGQFKIAHNKSRIPKDDLGRILLAMRLYIDDYVAFWQKYFDYLTYLE